MKLVVASVVLGSLLVVAGAACGRKAEAVGQTQTTSATVVPTETERTTTTLPAEPAPPPMPPTPPAVESTYPVPGIVDDRGTPPGRARGTLSVIHAGDVSANLDVPPVPSETPVAPPPAASSSEPAPLVPNASSPTPWTGTR